MFEVAQKIRLEYGCGDVHEFAISRRVILLFNPDLTMNHRAGMMPDGRIGPILALPRKTEVTALSVCEDFHYRLFRYSCLIGCTG